jgi:hypothetical protein
MERFVPSPRGRSKRSAMTARVAFCLPWTAGRLARDPNRRRGGEGRHPEELVTSLSPNGSLAALQAYQKRAPWGVVRRTETGTRGLRSRKAAAHGGWSRGRASPLVDRVATSSALSARLCQNPRLARADLIFSEFPSRHDTETLPRNTHTRASTKCRRSSSPPPRHPPS